MADLTQSLYSAEEKLRTRGIQAKVIAKPADGREADPEVGKVPTLFLPYKNLYRHGNIFFGLEP